MQFLRYLIFKFHYVHTAECREAQMLRKQPWPATITKNENWDAVYAEQKGSLSVLSTVDEAIAWANDLIQQIANIPTTNH